jgi:hypothetical protein
MGMYKKTAICIFLSSLSAMSLAVESPDRSLPQQYEVTSGRSLNSLESMVGEVNPEQKLFSIKQNTPNINFLFIQKPRPEVTGNPSIDNLNIRQMNECIRAFGANPVVCGN